MARTPPVITLLGDAADSHVETKEERKTLITDITVDVFRLIGEWTDTTNLTATNRFFFYNVKQFMYLKLNNKYSLQYYRDDRFRELVLSRVDKPRKQLSLFGVSLSSISWVELIETDFLVGLGLGLGLDTYSPWLTVILSPNFTSASTDHLLKGETSIEDALFLAHYNNRYIP